MGTFFSEHSDRKMAAADPPQLPTLITKDVGGGYNISKQAPSPLYNSFPSPL